MANMEVQFQIHAKNVTIYALHVQVKKLTIAYHAKQVVICENQKIHVLVIALIGFLVIIQ
jgi:hypothetical protein